MRAVLGLGIASTWLVGIASAGAVVILDSTWAEEGGTNADPSAGFGAHIDLAYEPQFEATIAFSSDGETVGDCSGAWIGNDDDYAYVLTAAHCFEADADGSEFYQNPSQCSAYTPKGLGGGEATGDQREQQYYDPKKHEPIS
ncbi:MAG: hypothetical protein ACFCU9_15570 [Cyanophyceae cyanobacterium]